MSSIECRVGKLDLEHSMTLDVSGELIKDTEVEKRVAMAIQ